MPCRFYRFLKITYIIFTISALQNSGKETASSTLDLLGGPPKKYFWVILEYFCRANVLLLKEQDSNQVPSFPEIAQMNHLDHYGVLTNKKPDTWKSFAGQNKRLPKGLQT